MTAGLCHAQQHVEKGELLNHQGQICADLDLESPGGMQQAPAPQQPQEPDPWRGFGGVGAVFESQVHDEGKAAGWVDDQAR